MSARPTVLVVARMITDGFMRDDLRYLAAFSNPVTLEFARAPASGRVARILWAYTSFVRLLRRSRARVVVFWFASSTYTPGMSLLARLLGARVIVITGGIDAVYVSSIDWGALRSPWSRFAFGLSMRLADVVLPFSTAALETLKSYARPHRARVLFPAIDTELFRETLLPRVSRVVTCCYEYDANNIVQKGLDVFVAAARLLPDVPFVLVGDAGDEAARRFAAAAPRNVELRPRIANREEYAAFLATSAVYAQLSAHEGFGVSVAEAMAAGAIPVVSDRYSLPEVVHDAGYVVPYGDARAAADAVQRARSADEGARLRARARAMQFVAAKRQSGLEEEVRRLL